jgi:hypothetical protein
MPEGRAASNHRSSQESEEARTSEAGFFLQVFLRERRYANLGHLLPISYRASGGTRCVGPPSWLASHLYPTTVRTFGYTPVGHETGLYELDVLGTRAFLPLAFRVGHPTPP